MKTQRDRNNVFASTGLKPLDKFRIEPYERVLVYNEGRVVIWEPITLRRTG